MPLNSKFFGVVKAGALTLSLAMSLQTAALAGRSCETQPLTPRAVQQGLGLAASTAASLDAMQAKVVVLARAGQDLREYGLRYSHLGLAYKDGAQWRVVHKLNQCGSDQAFLYRQGLGDFFLDTPYEYIAGVVVLAPDVQARLLPLLKDDARVQQLNTRGYNMLAYPWSQQHQQSNQWAIETLALALSPEVNNREQAQAWLRLKGYEPTELHLSAMTRLGARLTAANISFDDHPASLRFTGRIRTITVDSVFEWLARSKLGDSAVLVP